MAGWQENQYIAFVSMRKMPKRMTTIRNLRLRTGKVERHTMAMKN